MKLRVLLVEDDLEKARRIAEVVARVTGTHQVIVHAADGQTGRLRLASQQFDVAIIDLAIPHRLDAEVDGEAGASLLRDIVGRPNKIIAPVHCLVVTRYLELSHAFKELARAVGARIVVYDAHSRDWEADIEGVVAHAVRARAGRRNGRALHHVDAAIISALATPELDAVLRLPWGWQAERIGEDPTIYHCATVNGRNVVAANAPRMGLPAASALTAKLIAEWRPRYVLIVGIAAGVRGRVHLGDVVVADTCWDWGDGKWVAEDGSLRFLPSPHQLQLDPSVRSAFEPLVRDRGALATIMKDWPGEYPPGQPILRMGPFASGASVLADGSHIADILQQHRQLLAVDMEAYGVGAACQEARGTRPLPIVLKGVVDFADGEKNDRWQRYAASAAAETARWFVENAMADDRQDAESLWR